MNQFCRKKQFLVMIFQEFYLKTSKQRKTQGPNRCNIIGTSVRFDFARFASKIREKETESLITYEMNVYQSFGNVC